MRRRRLVGLAVLALAGCLAAVLILRLVMTVEEDPGGRFERGETLVVVSTLRGGTCALFRAGQTIDESTRIIEFDGSSVWLPAGRYFLQATGQHTAMFFPITLTGFRSGPDEDGTFLVAVRSGPSVTPPRLLPDLPPDVYIPSGTFLLGDRRNPREPHNVWQAGYFIAPFEVSNEEFRRFVLASDGYNDPVNWTDEGGDWKRSSPGRSTALLTPADIDYERFGKPDQPVTWVTWFEAHAFCRWLTRVLGGGRWQFGLPTESEWEKAARGPDGFDYSLGVSISDDQVSLYNWKKNPWATETVVGWKSTPLSFRPNRYGLFHLTGNVVEWTQSLHVPYNREHPYREDRRNNDSVPGSRVARGGSWYSASIAYLSISYRDSFQPGHSSQDLGFRLAARLLP